MNARNEWKKKKIRGLLQFFSLEVSLNNGCPFSVQDLSAAAQAAREALEKAVERKAKDFPKRKKKKKNLNLNLYIL